MCDSIPNADSADPRARARGPRRPRAGFTLIEMLVVVVIIIILASIALPMLMKSLSTAKRNRAAQDLQVITVALNAYYADFKSYPTVDPAALAPVPPLTGADVLGRAVIGPGPAVGSRQADGAEGPGFRAKMGGKVYGPYLKPDSFKVPTIGTDTYILDNFYKRPGDSAPMPILYFPALPRKPNVTVAKGFVTDQLPGPPAVPALFNWLDNKDVGSATPGDGNELSYTEMCKILGDTNGDGAINNGEKAADTGPFLLWSPGPDGRFGLDNDGKTDDITNFDIPIDLRK
jgi:prepilin-type N-terminal cleavage/methylation domain-containing protein